MEGWNEARQFFTPSLLLLTWRTSDARAPICCPPSRLSFCLSYQLKVALGRRQHPGQQGMDLLVPAALMEPMKKGFFSCDRLISWIFSSFLLVW